MMSVNHGSAQENTQSRAKCVLVVDDDDSIRNLLVYGIRRMGHDVMTASNGQEAMKLLNMDPHAVDMILTDIWMPSMTGLDLLREVSAFNPPIPVAMISGQATVSSAIDAINMGAYAYLQKPFQHRQIQDVVNRGLAKSAELRTHPSILELEQAYNDQIVKLKQLEQALRNSSQNTKAVADQQSNQVIATLIDGLRHELGNLAFGISLNLSSINPDEVPSELRQNLGDLRASAEDLSALVEKLTQYPTLDSTAERHDLKKILRLALDDIGMQTIDKGIHMLQHMPDAPCFIYCDFGSMRRAIWHLLGNAIDVTPKDGQVEVTIQSRTDTDSIELRIEDSGPGFDEDKLAQSTLPGFTTKITNGFVRGLGLGLFIARTTVEMHGGEIALSNRAQGGAQVTVKFPGLPRKLPIEQDITQSPQKNDE